MLSFTLNNTMFPVIHKQTFENVDLKDIANEFVLRNERRQHYSVNFNDNLASYLHLFHQAKALIFSDICRYHDISIVKTKVCF